ncbi:hypothetical protein BHM03_00050870 [Ensete ventricosum]|nr:hypothetical protein BHM03_00050870 [Ensete ventricosum]
MATHVETIQGNERERREAVFAFPPTIPTTLKHHQKKQREKTCLESLGSDPGSRLLGREEVILFDHSSRHPHKVLLSRLLTQRCHCRWTQRWARRRYTKTLPRWRSSMLGSSSIEGTICGAIAPGDGAMWGRSGDVGYQEVASSGSSRVNLDNG